MQHRFRLPHLFLLLIFLTSLWMWLIAYTPTLPKHDSGYKINMENFTYMYPIDTLPRDDYNRLINLTNFSFQIVENVCLDLDPFLLVVVHTSPTNFERRKIIRETWGQDVNGVKLVFMLGRTEDTNTQNKLKKESKKHKDFVQGNFKDSYRNLTYKHVMVFKYVIYHCPEAKYILKTDDDVFVNILALLEFLRQQFSSQGASDLLFCRLRFASRVLRSYRIKWRVSVKEYPGRTYPPHCPGYVVVYSPDVVFSLYKDAQRTKYFWIDDVHITGTLALKNNISHTDASPYMIYDAKLHQVLDGPCLRKQFLFGIFKKEKDIRDWWNNRHCQV